MKNYLNGEMEENSNNRQLTCILFPGVVNDADKAIRCLGGIRSISRVYTEQSKTRLGLTFQPDNPYIKKCFANAKTTAGVAISVKVKKIKCENNEVKRHVVSTKILGRVSTIFKFESMFDFQVLPIQKEGSGPPKCIIEQILPSGVDKVDFLTGSAPLMILPAAFTRNEKPSNYCYTDKRYPNERLTKMTGEDEEFHSKMRADRMVPGLRIEFNLVDEFPTKPLDIFLTRKNERATVHAQMDEEFEAVKQLFEKRPIWTTNLVRYETKIRIVILKHILPCLAYYLKNGPWRAAWVKYGYDPRKDPGARIYQSLDFRLRLVTGVHSMVSSRLQFAKYKRTDRVRNSKAAACEIPASEGVAEGAVYLRPGLAPAQRQIFYQYCDIHLPEVQQIISVEPRPGYLCHPVRGWLPPNTADKCRDIIFKHVQETLLNVSTSELHLEEGESSNDESDFDDDDGTSTTATEIDDVSNI